MKDLIFLYGPSGSGKSTVGKILSKVLNLPFIDLDDTITKIAGKPIPAIFAKEGEPGFRNLEKQGLVTVIEENKKGLIALGGGALLDEENRELAEKNGQVLLLKAHVETLEIRLKSSATTRPLLAGNLLDRLNQLLDGRAEHYASFPNQIDTTSLSTEEVAKQAQIRLGHFRISGMGAEYPVWIQSGGIKSLGEKLTNMSSSIAVVTDENVGRHYGEQIMAELQEFSATLIMLPAGEEYKNQETLSKLWDEFHQAKLDRQSAVIALGGGVIGDLTGFAAATYLRGIDWVNVPTSLLAMVDAGLGGKTGIDLPMGKNLAGAFHPPRMVLIDPDLLATLPKDELRSGMAEVVKHGVIGDGALFELCGQGWEAVKQNLPALVRQAAAVKAIIIEEDPYEKGVRASLNLGHTIGHAVEAASGYSIRHGEAVAIGMAAEAKLAEEMGITKKGVAGKIWRVLKGLGLPTEIPENIKSEEWMPYMYSDKKRAGGKVLFALPVKIEEVRTGVEIDKLEERIRTFL